MNHETDQKWSVFWLWKTCGKLFEKCRLNMLTHWYLFDIIKE